MDNRAIAQALVARYTGLTATNGAGANEGLASAPAYLLPNVVNATPVILVYLPEGDYDIGPSQIRQGASRFTVRMLRDPMDYPSRIAWMYGWDNAMRDRVEGHTGLGLSYVSSAHVIRFRLVTDGWTYDTKTFDLVEHIVEVGLYEVGVPVGP